MTNSVTTISAARGPSATGRRSGRQGGTRRSQRSPHPRGGVVPIAGARAGGTRLDPTLYKHLTSPYTRAILSAVKRSHKKNYAFHLRIFMARRKKIVSAISESIPGYIYINRVFYNKRHLKSNKKDRQSKIRRLELLGNIFARAMAMGIFLANKTGDFAKV
jgi:hypothetical protein